MKTVSNYFFTILLTLLFAADIHAVTVSYYEDDGKGTVSDTDGRELRNSIDTTDPYSQLFYVQESHGRRACIGFFNIFGTDQYQIPEGADITSANLRLVKLNYTGVGTGTLYKATSAWEEFTVTWPGPSYSTDPEDTATFSYEGGPYQTIYVDVTNVVQEWADNPSVNFGWMFTAQQTAGSTNTYFASDDSTNDNYRVALTVTYEEPEPEPIPEPATLILTGCALIGFIRRFKK